MLNVSYAVKKTVVFCLCPADIYLVAVAAPNCVQIAQSVKSKYAEKSKPTSNDVAICLFSLFC